MELWAGFPTCTVTVHRPVATDEVDAMGDPVERDEEALVAGVVFAPGSSSDLAAKREDGTKTYATFHFPKTYTPPLKGCSIEHDGAFWRVIGDPVAYPVSPSPWNRPVEGVLVDG